MKFIIFQADGMPYRPLKQLDNKTPLEVAKTPTINRILEKSEVGIDSKNKCCIQRI